MEIQEELRVALLQMDLAWEDRPANLHHADRLIAELPQTIDLIVLPEMFSTGFSARAEALADTMDGETLRQIRHWAESRQAAVTGSFIVRENDRYHNRGFAILPDGRAYFYDKHHLFFGGEKSMFTPGGTRPVFEFRGWRISLAICYDLRFPVFMRGRRCDYDLMILPVEWPKSRQEMLDILVRARAIENQAYYCLVNRVGTDGMDLVYQGGSQMVKYNGKVIERLTDYQEEVRIVTLEHYPLESYREKAPIWQDGDDFQLL
ncbi:MAG: nitrilase family protein [Paludibacteraceae bacterium]|nr:nitrilase family protein [Paludibacteraceae bacterium]